MVRTVSWTVYLDAQHEVRTGQGYKYGSSSYALVKPISITKTDPSGRVTDEIQATTSSTSSVPTGSVPQSDWTRWTHHHYGADGFLTHTDVYHLIPGSGAGTEGTNFSRTRFGYDAMGRRNYVKSPAGTITRTVHDPRGLVLSTWVGTNDTGATDTNPAGSGAPNNMRAVTINLYDVEAYGSANDSLDGLLTKVTSPVDDNSANDRIVEYRYDWRDRQVKQITSDGTNTFEAENVYDNLGRVTTSTETRLGSPNRLIAQSVTHYDDRGQVYRTEQYAVSDAGMAGTSLVSNTWYDAEGNTIKSLPAGSEAFTKNVYDAIGRQTVSYIGYYDGLGTDSPLNLTDNLIFEQSYTEYNKASSVLWAGNYARYHNASSTVFGALVPGTTARPDYTAFYHDGIGRSVATALYGNQGNDGATFTRPNATPAAADSTANLLISQTVYNAKGEAEDQIIPLEEQTSPTPPTTQTTRTEYDDAGRVSSTTRNYGSLSTEVVQMAYNADSQLETLTAVNADTGDQVTTYSYGVTLAGGSEIQSNSLLASVKYPDLGEVFYQYNRQGQRIKLTDQNESIHEYDYDKLGRQTADRVATLGSGVNGDVRRIEWSYDERKRLYKVTSYNAASSGTVTNEVEFEYNEFNQLRFEYQQHDGEVTGGSPKVEYTYANGSDNTIRRESCVYPDATELAYDYGNTADGKLSRLSGLTWDSTSVTEYEYLGLNQVVIQAYPDTTTPVEYTLAPGGTPADYTGMDRFGRITNLLWKQGSTPLVDLKYGYDLGSNRTFRRDNLGNGSGYSEAYVYDKLQRLTKFERGELNSTNSGFVGSKTLVQDWTLDSTGNWIGYDQSMTGAFDTTRTHDEANKIETITTNSSPPAWFTPPDYDANGNTTEMPDPLLVSNQLDATYDAWNRLVATNNGTNAVTYAYDGMNRRITKTVSSTVRHFYHSDQWQVLEERLGSSSSADRKYVWGLRYVDDLVLRDTSSERLYALQDALFNVVALADDDADVVERFAYQPYGESKALNPDYTMYSGTNYSWVYRFTGRELDTETGLQINRNRYLHHQLGRWINRDPIGYNGGLHLYRYCLRSPINQLDASGKLSVAMTQNLPSSQGRINPAVRDKLAGSRWRWDPQNGDGPTVGQTVEVEGLFHVTVENGNNHSVEYRESYTEAWILGGPPRTRTDSHMARPQKPAQYLESKLAEKFTVKAKVLYLGGLVVCGWHWNRKAKFTMANGSYPNWNIAPIPGFYLGVNQFQITSLVLNDIQIAAPQPNNVFDSALYNGGPSMPPVPNGLPPNQVGPVRSASDTWKAEYTYGDRWVTNVYTTTGYV